MINSLATSLDGSLVAAEIHKGSSLLERRGEPKSVLVVARTARITASTSVIEP